MELIQQQSQNQKISKKSKILQFLEKSIFQAGWKYSYKPIGICALNEKIQYLTTVFMPRSKLSICLLWTYTFNRNDLVIKVILYEDTNSKYALIMRKLIERDYYGLLNYLSLVNDLAFDQRLGCFSILVPSPKLMFRVFQGQFLSKDNDPKYELFFIKKLAYVNQLFANQIELILQKFKILPKPDDTQQQLKLKNNLLVLKEVFEQKRINRPKSSNVDLRLKKIKYAGDQVKILLMGDQNINEKIKNITQAKIKDVSYEFQKRLIQLKEDLNELFSQKPFIMLPISINQIVHETQMSKGGFGKISKGRYLCKYNKTVNQKVNQQLKKNISFQEQINLMLCKKECLKNGQYAFQNQKQVLMKIRNKRCPYIAQYYSQTGYNFLESNKIYLQAYCMSLQKAKLTLTQRMVVSDQLIKGLWFLIENQFVHRDVKPENLMLDNKLNLRIIDFGSCCYVFDSKQVPFNNKIYVTKGFFSEYAAYGQLFKTPDSKFKMTQQEFYRHSLFDIYSFGKVLQFVFNMSYYEQFQKNYIMEELKYLAIKCTQVNPADRIGHEQIVVFMDCLLRLHSLQEINII